MRERNWKENIASNTLYIYRPQKNKKIEHPNVWVVAATTTSFILFYFFRHNATSRCLVTQHQNCAFHRRWGQKNFLACRNQFWFQHARDSTEASVATAQCPSRDSLLPRVQVHCEWPDRTVGDAALHPRPQPTALPRPLSPPLPLSLSSLRLITLPHPPLPNLITACLGSFVALHLLPIPRELRIKWGLRECHVFFLAIHSHRNDINSIIFVPSIFSRDVTFVEHIFPYNSTSMLIVSSPYLL